MAKRKETLTEGSETLELGGNAGETGIEQTTTSGGDSGGDSTETKNPEIKPEETKVETKTDVIETKASEDLPEIAKIRLKQFPGEKELYIDRQGGVFKRTTKPAIVKNAILYKNPFYNK